MRIIRFIFVVTPILVLLGLLWSLKSQRQPASTTEIELPKIHHKKMVQRRIAPSPSTIKKETQLQDYVHRESLRVGKVDVDPQKTQERLTAYAKSLKNKDFELLATISLDQTKNGDERFLAIYLLSLSGNEQAAPYLYRVSVANLKQESSNKFAEEVILRLQAIIGLSQSLDNNKKKEYLEKILTKQPNTFLASKARQLL